ADADGVVLTDTLPLNITGGWSDTAYSGTIAAGEVITWQLDALAGEGGGGSVALVVTTTTPLLSGTVLTNTAHVTCTQGTDASAQKTTQIQSAPALTLTKSGPDFVSAGGNITYTLAYTNTGNADASGVVLTDTLPLYITGGWSDTAYSGTIAAGEVITWQLGALAGEGGGGSVALVVTTTSPLTNSTVLTDLAGITCDQGSSASAQKETQVQSAPSLTVLKTAEPDPVTPGNWLSYTITVTNHSAATDWARGVIVTDTVPLSTTLLGADFGAGTSGTVDAPSSTPGSPITWTVSGNLSPGSSAVVTFTVAVTSPLDNGTAIRNSLVWVTCTQGVSDTYGPVDVTVSSVPVLDVVKNDAPDPAAAGSVLTYTITYSNSGTMAASGVWITDTLDDNVVFNGASPSNSTQAGQEIGWSLGNLSPQDGAQTIVLSVTVNTLADATVLTNTATITCAQGQGDTTGAVTTTVQAADVTVSKSAWPGTVRPDEIVTYTISFGNPGSLAASNVIVTDTLPLSVTLVTSDTAGAAFLSSDGNSFGWISPTVAAGSTGAITITARVTTTYGWLNPQSGVPITNSVVITSASAEANLTNNQAQAAVDVVPGLPATLTLTADPTLLSIDETAALTATVTDGWGNLAYNGDSLTVTFTTTLGTVSPEPANVVNGVAVANITSTLPGLATITGTVGSAPAVSDTAQITFTAGALDHFAISNVASPQVAGVGFTVSITAQDRYSNTVTGFAGPATLTDTTQTVTPTTLTPFVNGVWTGVITISNAYVGDVLTADAGMATGSSNPFTVTHNQPLTLTITPQGATVQAGYTQTYAVTGTDAYLNTWDASGEVTYTVSGGGSFPGTPPGNNVFSATTPLGTYVVTATAINDVFVTTTVEVTRGDAVSLTINPREATIPAGNTQAYTAVAADAYANQWDATGDTGFTASGGGTFIAPGNVYSATTAGTYLITGTLDSIQDSTGVTVTAGGLHHFVVGPVTSPQIAGANFTLVITASDVFGNPLVSNEAITLTDSTGTLLPTSAAFGGGVTTTVQVSITQVATGDVITVTAQTTPTIQGISNAFNVVANDPATVVLSGPAYEVPICGSGATVTATVRDAWNNPVTDSTLITFTTSGATVTPSTDGTTNGLAHTVINAIFTGAKPITATAPNGISATLKVTFTVGAPLDIALAAGATALTAGQNTTITATVRDCDNNPVSGAVDFTASIGSLSPASGTASNGVLTTTYNATTAGTAWITGTLEGGVDTAVVSITVSAGAPATITVTADPSQLPPDGVSTSDITAQVTDAWNNPVSGRVVTFTTTAGSINPGPVTTDSDGYALTVLTSASIEVTATVTAYCEGLSGQVQVPFRQFFVYLPLVARNYGPDLIVESITFDPAPPLSGQPYNVVVTIRNQGASFGQDFWVDLYLNPSEVPSVNRVWNDLSQVGYGKAWLVRDGLGAGQTVTLRTSDPDDPLAPELRYSNWPPPNYNASHNPFYVLADSWGYSYGTVQESNESNNLGQTVVGSGFQSRQSPGSPGKTGGPRPPLDVKPTPEPESTPVSLRRWQRIRGVL
ncbi:MAG: invasin domain 3-containing protein, partial [Chloroflexota bacterium]|nr:invasin domain 3-containing protein [Chloroflexota bacterium]